MATPERIQAAIVAFGEDADCPWVEGIRAGDSTGTQRRGEGLLGVRRRGSSPERI